MNNHIVKILSLSLAGGVIFGTSQAYGTDRLSQLWSHSLEAISQCTTPQQLRFAGIASGFGAAASLFVWHPYVAALCGTGVLAMDHIANKLEFYNHHQLQLNLDQQIKVLRRQLDQALLSRHHLKPVIKQLVSCMQAKEDTHSARGEFSLQVGIQHDLEPILLPVINQRTQQLIAEIKKKLETDSPHDVYEIYFDYASNSIALDLYDIFPQNVCHYYDARWDLYRSNPHYHKLLSLVQCKSKELMQQLINDVVTEVQAGKLVEEREYRHKYGQLLREDSWQFRDLLKRLRDQQYEKLKKSARQLLQSYVHGTSSIVDLLHHPARLTIESDLREILWKLKSPDKHKEDLQCAQQVWAKLIKGYASLSYEHHPDAKVFIKELIRQLIYEGLNPYMQDSLGKNSFNYAEGEQDIIDTLLNTTHSPNYDIPSHNHEMAPTMMEAFLAHHLHRGLHSQAKDIFTWLGTPENVRLFGMVKREQQFTSAYNDAIDQASHYVFYHAQSGVHRIIQDVHRHMLQFEQQDNIGHFIPLRFWHDCEKTSDIRDFIISTGLDGGTKGHLKGNINDNLKEIQQNLLAVNLSFLGNSYHCGESSMFYYRSNTSIAKYDPTELIKRACDYYDFNPAGLQEMIRPVNNTTGNILQIFIPRQHVNNAVYLAEPWGLPYKTDLGLEGFQALGATKCHTKITPIIDSIRSEKFIQHVSQQGHNGPRIIDELQARIVLGQDIMLNHKSGVKIFRVDQLSSEKAQQDQKSIGDFCRLMFIDWLERILQRNPDGTCGVKQEALNRIKDTPLGTLIQDHDRVRALLQKLRAEAWASASKDRQSHL